MPKGPKKILLGVLDAQPIWALKAIAKAPKSFTEVLDETAMPKATVHRTLASLVANNFLKKVGNWYTLTSDGEFVLEFFNKLRARSMLKITDDSLQRILNQVRRTMRMERLGFSRVEQFESVQEAVESVEVVEVPA
jgi:DNA-binding IclR family transcriptional regulator